MESIDETRDKPSVFTLVTTNDRNFVERSIAVVIDRKRTDYHWEKYKKYPGGGVKLEETEEEAAEIELKEETGITLKKRLTHRLLEVHKTSRINQISVHKDIFFLSDLVTERIELRPENPEEIEYAAWENIGAVLEQIHAQKFVPNHAYALIWFLVRDEYLKTRKRVLLHEILNDPYLRNWGVENDKLILCFSPWCRECTQKKNMNHRSR